MRRRHALALTAAAALALGCASSPCPCQAAAAAAPPPGPAPVAERPEAARLEAIAKRLDILAGELFDFWRVHGPDPAHGGFHGTLGRAGEPKAPTDKGV